MLLCCSEKGNSQKQIDGIKIYEDYYGAYTNGKKIGYAYTSFIKQEKENDVNYILLESYHLVVKAFGEEQNLKMQLTQTFDANYNLLTFEFNENNKSDYITGKRVGNKIEAIKNGDRKTYKLPNGTQSYLQANKQMEKLLKTQKTFTISYFDVSLLETVKVENIVEEKTETFVKGLPVTVNKIIQDIYSVDSDKKIINDSLLYVTDANRTIRQEIMGGYISLRLEDEIIAKSPTEKVVDIIELNSIEIKGDLTQLSAEKNTFKLRKINPTFEANFPPDTEYQTVEKVDDGEFLITLSKNDVNKISDDSDKNTISRNNLPEDFSELTKASRYIRITPEIKALAEKIKGNETNTWKIAKKLKDWLYKNLRKEYYGGALTSDKILSQRQGDCTEHSILFAALARSLGIPTAVVTGLVIPDGKNRFYHHAWNSILVNGKFIDIDATLNVFPIEAVYIRLYTGNYSDSLYYNDTISKMTVEIELVSD